MLSGVSGTHAGVLSIAFVEEQRKTEDCNNPGPAPGPSPRGVSGGRKNLLPNTCRRRPQGSGKPASSPDYIGIATWAHSAFIRGRWGVRVLLQGRPSTILCQKLNFLISAGVQGFEPSHNVSSLSCSIRSKTFHNTGAFRKVTLKSPPCSKHPESSVP